jgi:hypothetical protein
MDAEQVLSTIGAEQGWNTGTRLDLALRFIQRQDEAGAFGDFLRTVQYEENDTGEEG